MTSLIAMGEERMRKEDSGNVHSFTNFVLQGTREMGRWLEGDSGMRKKLFKMGDTNEMCMKMGMIRQEEKLGDVEDRGEVGKGACWGRAGEGQWGSSSRQVAHT